MSKAHFVAGVVSAAVLLALLFLDPAAAQRRSTVRCISAVPDGETEGYVPLPTGDVFCPLLADPKQPHSFVSYLHGTSGSFATDIGAIGIGEHFGLMRLGTFQVSISAGIFAQFDLRSESYDLINADYVIGLPLTYRQQGFSARLRAYHQSSHLGDELLLRNPPTEVERENLSFESLEVILSQELGPLRLYAGGEYLFNLEPENLESRLIHAGVELYPAGYFLRIGQLGQARFVAAGDVKAPAEQDWSPAISVRAGLEVGRVRESGYPTRRWMVTGEFYTGPSPYGQFFDEQVTYYGLGMHLSL